MTSVLRWKTRPQGEWSWVTGGLTQPPPPPVACNPSLWIDLRHTAHDITALDPRGKIREKPVWDAGAPGGDYLHQSPQELKAQEGGGGEPAASPCGLTPDLRARHPSYYLCA